MEVTDANLQLLAGYLQQTLSVDPNVRRPGESERACVRLYVCERMRAREKEKENKLHVRARENGGGDARSKRVTKIVSPMTYSPFSLNYACSYFPAAC